MGSGGLLIEAKAVSGVTTMTATPTVGPVAVFRATYLEYPDGHLGVTCANCPGTFSGLGGPSRVDQPPLRAVSTRPEVEVYTLRCKGDLEGVCRLRAKTRQDSPRLALVGTQ